MSSRKYQKEINELHLALKKAMNASKATHFEITEMNRLLIAMKEAYKNKQRAKTKEVRQKALCEGRDEVTHRMWLQGKL